MESSLLYSEARSCAFSSVRSTIILNLCPGLIVYVSIDSKLISVFGLARSFKGDSIREAYLQAYPRLVADLQTKPENRGLVSFISDYLVDFKFLAKGAGNPDSDPDAGPDNEKPKTNLEQETAIPRSVQV